MRGNQKIREIKSVSEFEALFKNSSFGELSHSVGYSDFCAYIFYLVIATIQ